MRVILYIFYLQMEGTNYDTGFRVGLIQHIMHSRLIIVIVYYFLNLLVVLLYLVAMQWPPGQGVILQLPALRTHFLLMSNNVLYIFIYLIALTLTAATTKPPPTTTTNMPKKYNLQFVHDQKKFVSNPECIMGCIMLYEEEKNVPNELS